MTFQQRFEAGATGYQQYDAGSIAVIDAAAGAERFSAATMWASQEPNGLAQAPHAGMSAEVTRRIFELGRAAMMREEQEARGATASAPATATAVAAAQLMTPQQLAMNAPNATVPPTGTETGASSDSTSNESGAATRRRVESPAKATDAEVEDITPWQIYTDFLDRCDAHSSSVDERALNIRRIVPRWDEVPLELSARMLLRE